MSKLYLEITGIPVEEGAEHPLEYFKKELEEFFEQFGWEIKLDNAEEEDEE